MIRKKILNPTSSLLEGFDDVGTPDMKYYAFDWDDNIMMMPTKIILKDENDNEAESVEEATIVASKYRSGDVRSSESISIAKMPIECVIDEKNTPEYYKS